MPKLRAALLVFSALLLLQACEDDPILEPTEDDTGGGSYGNLSPLNVGDVNRTGASNPATF